MAKLSLVIQVCLICIALAVSVQGRRNNRRCTQAERLRNANCIPPPRRKHRKGRSVLKDMTDINTEEFLPQLSRNEDEITDGSGEELMAHYKYNIREVLRRLHDAGTTDGDRMYHEVQSNQLNQEVTSNDTKERNLLLGSVDSPSIPQGGIRDN